MKTQNLQGAELDNERMEFIQSLPLIMHKAGELGLWRTMHKLHYAVKESGWEMADMRAIVAAKYGESVDDRL